jgi:hypothetical protein
MRVSRNAYFTQGPAQCPHTIETSSTRCVYSETNAFDFLGNELDVNKLRKTPVPTFLFEILSLSGTLLPRRRRRRGRRRRKPCVSALLLNGAINMVHNNQVMTKES